MALTKEQQAIEDAYQRAKAKAQAQKDLQLKQAAENLALQTKQIGQLQGQAKQTATQQASQAYVNTQQAKRVLPSQMAQSGLAQTGYKSLAQQKMEQDLTKTRQNVSQGLGQQMAGYQRSAEADKLSYDQNVRSTTNTFNQNIADLNLDKKQALNTQTDTVNSQNNLADLVAKANAGGMDRDAYRKALVAAGVSSADITAYLQIYDRKMREAFLRGGTL